MTDPGHSHSGPTSSTTLELDKAKWLVEVEWGVAQGRFEPVRVSISSVPEPSPTGEEPQRLPLTAARIRRLSLGGAISDLRRTGEAVALAETLYWDERIQTFALHDDVQTAVLHQDFEEVDRLLKEIKDRAPRYYGLESLVSTANAERDQLDTVAAIYRSAYARHKEVTEAVMKTLDVSRGNAGKLIMAAKKAGLLNDLKREI